MFYAHTIDVEPGITRDNPKVYEIPLNEKWITDIWVGFESGCGWCIGVRIYYGIRRYFPENPDGWIYGDAIYIPINQIVKLPAKAESIKVYYHSEWAIYPHTIYILVWTSDEEVEPVEVLLSRMEKLWQKII
jgi:hypothetical protein